MLPKMREKDIPPEWEYSMELLKDPIRIRILRALSKKSHTLEELSETAGVKNEEALLYHLGVLKDVERLGLKSEYASGSSVKKVYSVNQSVAKSFLTLTEYIRKYLSSVS